MAGEQRPAVTGLSDRSVAWGSLAQSLVSLGTAAVPGSTEVIQVIRALCGIENAQAVLLQRIGHDVELIRTGPFRAAREHLATAMRKSAAGTEYEGHLVEAENLLIQALGQCASAEESSLIQFNLGVVAAIRGDRAEADYRLKQAYRDSVKVTLELSKRASDTRFAKNPKARAALVWMSFSYLGLPIVIAKVAQLKRARAARSKLVAYLPFAEATARAHNAITPAEALPEPRLRRLGKGFHLEWPNTS